VKATAYDPAKDPEAIRLREWVCSLPPGERAIARKLLQSTAAALDSDAKPRKRKGRK
jgi:hypothetical protein